MPVQALSRSCGIYPAGIAKMSGIFLDANVNVAYRVMCVCLYVRSSHPSPI